MRGGRKNLRFFANRSLYLSNGARYHLYRLLLIANRKSYTGSQLPPSSVIVDDLERQNRGFVFLAISCCETHVKGGLHRNQLR